MTATTTTRRSDDIFRALLEDHNSMVPLEVADLIQHQCSYRNYLNLLGETWGNPLSGAELALRAAHEGWRDVWIRKYFKGAYGADYRPSEPFYVHNQVLVRFEGFLEGMPLFVELRPDESFRDGQIPKFLQNIIAARSFLLGENERARVLVVNQNNQKWNAWTLHGDFSEIGQIVEDEINYLAMLSRGDAEGVGIRSSCDGCPFETVCDVEDKLDTAETIPRVEYRVQKDTGMLKKLEDYLWSRNEGRTGRKTNVIHPSELTGSPQGKKCDRYHGYSLNGAREERKIDPGLFRIFDMGHAWHDFIQVMGHYLYGEDYQDEIKIHHPELEIAGSCDDVLYDDVGEIKTISAKGFDSLSKPKNEHIDQATLYAMAPQVLKKYIRFLYVNKNTGQIKEFRPKVSSQRWRRLSERAARILTTVREGNMPDRLEDDGYICKGCKYLWTCKPHLTAARRFKR